ncbi:anti-sigma factor family protein [Actinoplanes sp. NPDC051859]|uniref:anti-sigma factor family protein n=1 Tax=Actinoplanes sp. NPDC051859 TaxID=3363909 RepID=UPI00378DB5D5
MRCDHEHDDGAYVLGALSPGERAAYERHLATCSFCREAVADIAVLPGLLGRLDASDFERLLDPDLAPPPPRRRLSTPDLSAVAAPVPTRPGRRRGRWRTLGVALAAACLALVVGIGAVFWTGSSRSNAETESWGPTVAMTAASDLVPVSAELNLAGAAGGTKIKLWCAYNRVNAESESYTIRLMAYGPDKESEQLGSWTAAPGKEFSMSGVTHFASGALARLALIRNDGRTLLSYDVP